MKKSIKNQEPSLRNLEVGTVYVQPKTGHLFLAATPLVLIRLVGGKVQKVERSSRWEVVRSVSVRKLLISWGFASVEDLDAAMFPYLCPKNHRSRTRQHNKGSHRSQGPSEPMITIYRFLQ